MRTTLEIDDRVLAAARSVARARGLSLGEAVSQLALRGLTTSGSKVELVDTPFPVLVGDPDHPVTDELVRAHRDES